MPAITMTAAISAGKDLIDIAEKTGFINKIKSKLITQPDPAATYLAVVLGELSKIYLALDSEMTAYLSLTFYDGMSPVEEREARKILLGFQGGATEVRIAESRGHSTKITNIYQRFLNPWFQRTLGNDYSEMTYVFNELQDVDGRMISAMNFLAAWLNERAGETNRLLLSGNKAGAEKSVREAEASEVGQLRRSLAQTVARLRVLQSEFIGISGAIG